MFVLLRRRSLPVFVVLATILLISPFLTAPAKAQAQQRAIYLDVERVLHTIPLTGGKDVILVPKTDQVREYRVTADGHVVYWAQKDNGLYSVPVEGGAAVKLSKGALAGNDTEYFFPFQISPDGKQVVFLAQNEQRKTSIYSVSTAGGEPVALLPDNLTFLMDRYNAKLSFYSILPGNNVIIKALTGRDVAQLYLVPLTGGEPRQLNGKLASGGNVSLVVWSGDGKRVLYLADQAKDEAFGWYSVSTDGGDPVLLTEGDGNYRPLTGRIYPVITATNKVVMPLSGGHVRLYSVPVEGGSMTLLVSESEGAGEFRVSADGTTVLYHAGDELRQVPVAGGKPGKVIDLIALFDLTPDKKFLLAIGTKGLVSASFPSESGKYTSHVINPPGKGFDGINTFSFAALISPDGQTAVMLVRDKDSVGYLYAAPLDGSKPPVQLNSAPGTARFSMQASVTSDNTTVVYINNEETEKVADLYVVPITGGKATRLTTDDSKSVVSVKVFPVGANWSDIPARRAS